MAGKSAACAGCPNQNICASGEARKPDPSLPLIAENMSSIPHKILILSGKGGVGKSTVCATIAQYLHEHFAPTAVLDVDLCGPSQGRMQGCPEGSRLHQSATGLSPVFTDSGMAVVSMSFMVDSSETAIIWRGDKKTSMIRQLLRDCDFTGVDCLVVDTPPGTSDEHLALAQMFTPCVAVLVTTPQEVAWQDVRKQVDFCKKTNIPILGIVENMSGGVKCLHCGHVDTDLFLESGIADYAHEHGIAFLGKIPIDQSIAIACDQGLPVIEHTESRDALISVAEAVVSSLKNT